MFKCTKCVEIVCLVLGWF